MRIGYDRKNRLIRKQNKKIWDWYCHERERDNVKKFPSDRVMFALKYIADHGYKIHDFDYDEDWLYHLEYACDRMNSGRAKAILKLIKEQKSNDYHE